MSTINPLIDTLLHQVLGRRGDVSNQRLMDQPIKPVVPGEGPRALMGDARLDGRDPASTALRDTALRDMRGLPSQLDGGRQPQRGDAQALPPGSTQTHFSPAARSIADVLLRFPAPPTVMRAEAPLMNAAESPSSTQLAARLEASVRDSGLFYEAHLKRWFQGEANRQQLLREPQMQPGPRASVPTPLASTALGAGLVPQGGGSGISSSGMVPGATSPLLVAPPPPGNAAILPNTSLIPAASESAAARAPVVNTPATIQSPVGSPGTFNTAELAPHAKESPQANIDARLARDTTLDVMPNRQPREVVHESLQSLVRQQLEMLVTPTIRWEGDVWAGIFMALAINLPTRGQHQEDGEEQRSSDDSWQSDMQLDVPGFGAFSVSLRLYRGVLNIDLTASEAQVHQRLEAGVPALESRLEALDLRKVQVRARYVEEAPDVFG
ncbi:MULTISPECIES: flagellar hook-length control protein FliK [Halomonadaceae]|uniref:flagellar hook-length control protein FliK n=1 Tax=Halomonadaceae TaxID=28256 RepID=UPI0018EFF740|nr:MULTISPECIES: flagellar hook-length control protein FliK [Halomonas]MCO7247798.1 flagellar hook-length control protein FliK [Halomonas sp. Mc5H-6]MCW4151255.1 flagellar hook-length control protein FliK [Halomonas sp. 18H]MDR5887246.1 flagellar hook-length control protein FliK [Halomonas janggokensis]QPL46332.1 flagellar hook-length control protein FliK [Halomonas sp. A40-4]